MTLTLQHQSATGGTDFNLNPFDRYITRNVGAPSGSGATESLVNWDRTGIFGTEATGNLQCDNTTVIGSLQLSRTLTVN